MKQLRLVLICMMATVVLSSFAQKNKERELYRSTILNTYSEPTWDEAIGDTVVIWEKTANKYRGDSAIVRLYDIDTVNVGSDIGVRNMSVDDLKSRQMTYLVWRLTENDKATILHCYFMMPANAVKRMWLGGEETYIVDQETGVHYKPRGSKPNVWQKYFTLEAPKGTLVDFTITFPPLPKTVRNIAIYGVPNWGFYNHIGTVTLNRKDAEYDTVPNFRTPRLIQPERNYSKNDAGSWAYYDNVHTIKPLKDKKTFAIWRTPETTYLAIPHDMTWTRQYWGLDDTVYLVDDATGNKYKIKKIQGLPLNHLFWIKGCAGDWFAYLAEFEPMPLSVTSVSYVEPEGKPFKAYGANWSGWTVNDLSVETMQENQKLFQYFPREVVE